MNKIDKENAELIQNIEMQIFKETGVENPDILSLAINVIMDKYAFDENIEFLERFI